MATSPTRELRDALALDVPASSVTDMVGLQKHPLLGTMKVLDQAVKVEGSETDWLGRPAPLLGERRG